MPKSSILADDVPGGIDFFEKRIRPVLVEKCYGCHSGEAKSIEGELRLDSRPGVMKGGANGPLVVAGEPEQSLLIKAVRRTGDLKMPPKESDRLSPEQVADFEAWVKRGLPDPRTEVPAGRSEKQQIDIKAARQKWPFAPVGHPVPPKVADVQWPRNPIDLFLRAAQEAKGLSPVGDADRRTLIRRATFDLIGLPPTPDDVARFVDDPDDTASAFSKVIDRLLESPHYGERWGRHWLDVVRYADTAGDNSDYPIPQMIKYRDWVIASFNADMPYDRFIREQLAGDLLTGNGANENGSNDSGTSPAEQEAARQQGIIATGYIASARRFGSRVDDYPQHLTIEDTIDNLGRAFLGLSLSCARCHDHKFDPITSEDYYALYGFFHSTQYPWPGIELDKVQRHLVPLASKNEMDRHLTQRANDLKPLQEAFEQASAELKRLQGEQPADTAKIGNQKRVVDQARQKKEEVEKQPFPFELAYAVGEGKKIENVPLQIKGNPEKPGDVVPRRFLAVLGGQPLPLEDRSSGRKHLADWIASAENPLTARVMVNRLWLHHFGLGLVPTPNDFGKQGRPPTHPELLDWLSRQFVTSGWSVKAMHRLMMNSHAYQLASHPTEQAVVEIDPGNELLTRFRRRRLDAESLRDTLLSLSGLLESGPGGPHPFPPQKNWNFTQHNPFKAVYESRRRSVYLMTQRIQRHPYLALFDGADTGASTAQRGTSITSLQALYLLNDDFVHAAAKGFSSRLIDSMTKDGKDGDRLDRAYAKALGRPITSAERAAAELYLTTAQERLRSSGASAEELEHLTWESLVRTLFRLNEFVTIE